MLVQHDAVAVPMRVFIDKEIWFGCLYLAVKVICDHVSGKSKGYGFVQFTSENIASRALEQMDGQVCSIYGTTGRYLLHCVNDEINGSLWR